MNLLKERDLLSRVADVSTILQPILAVAVVLLASGGAGGMSAPVAALGAFGLMMATGTAFIVVGRRQRNDWRTAFQPDRGLAALKFTVVGLVVSTLGLLGVVGTVVIPLA